MRDLQLDFVRSVAIVLVVVNHAAEFVYKYNIKEMALLSQADQIFAFSAFTFGRMGVPLFLMLSGYLLLPRKYDVPAIYRFWKRNWMPLLITWEFWILFDYGLYAWLRNTPFDVQSWCYTALFLKAVPNFGGFQWYMPMIIGVYVFIPFIACVLENTNGRVLLFPILLVFLCAFLYPNYSLLQNALHKGLKIGNKLDINFSGGAYGLYLLLGYGMYKGWFPLLRRRYALIAILVMFAFTVVYQKILYAINIKYNIWYNFSTMPIIGLLLFILIYKTKLPTCLHNFIISLSSKSFGIYLTHTLWNSIIQKFAPWIMVPDWIRPVRVITVSLISFSLAYIFVSFTSKIPKLRRLLYTMKD